MPEEKKIEKIYVLQTLKVSFQEQNFKTKFVSRCQRQFIDNE